jgi:hypothetical protein
MCERTSGKNECVIPGVGKINKLKEQVSKMPFKTAALMTQKEILKQEYAFIKKNNYIRSRRKKGYRE